MEWVEAFVNPEITTKFWFTKSSGRLEAGKQVQWDWEMYGISVPVTVRSIVSTTNAGFTGDGDQFVEQATDSTQGFSLVLAGLKALLEHNVRLNLVADRYPKGLAQH